MQYELQKYNEKSKVMMYNYTHKCAGRRVSTMKNHENVAIERYKHSVHIQRREADFGHEKYE